MPIRLGKGHRSLVETKFLSSTKAIVHKIYIIENTIHNFVPHFKDDVETKRVTKYFRFKDDDIKIVSVGYRHIMSQVLNSINCCFSTPKLNISCSSSELFRHWGEFFGTKIKTIYSFIRDEIKDDWNKSSELCILSVRITDSVLNIP